MELGKQLKEYRNSYNFSQEVLAEKIMVSRQTISNWENDKTYPDIHNLFLLSSIFNVSIDELVKGDVVKIKEKLQNKKRIKQMNTYVIIYSIFMLLAALSVGPVIRIESNWSMLITFVLFIPVIVSIVFLTKIKHTEDIKTFQEIVSFLEGQDVTPLRKKRDPIKEILFKFLYGTIFLSGVVAISLFSIWLFN